MYLYYISTQQSYLKTNNKKKNSQFTIGIIAYKVDQGFLNKTMYIGSNLFPPLWNEILLSTDYREFMKNNYGFLNYFNDYFLLSNLMGIQHTVH